MFSFNSGSTTKPRFALFKALAVPLCLITAFLFLGCPMEGSSGGGGGNNTITGNLVNTWEYVYDPGGANEFITTIKITKTTITYEGNYTGTIVNPPNLTTQSGVLIIQFTKYANNYDGNPVTTHANVGKYGALYWKDLSANSVYMADAYEGSTHTMFSNLQEAKTNFTLDNVGDYIDWSITSPYTKK